MTSVPFSTKIAEVERRPTSKCATAHAHNTIGRHFPIPHYLDEQYLSARAHHSGRDSEKRTVIYSKR